ncbi:MAG: hypothetical protein HC849_14860 [Oscillatoriales cyanobacterium RU_3_3]|nr:hypothetical protein [Microcoleus sp. SM1_3_4]NJM61195.1 hypothetical protein [Oscillatoriales cyanobacterium RU_3_3]NJR22241.1 hypothetical protein [Richelia sp. CSU_2_1]
MTQDLKQLPITNIITCSLTDRAIAPNISIEFADPAGSIGTTNSSAKNSIEKLDNDPSAQVEMNKSNHKRGFMFELRAAIA